MQRLFPVLVLAALTLAVRPVSADFPQWRGPNRDGISPEQGLLQEWSGDGPQLLYQAEGLGKGYSSVAIAGGKIYTMGQRKGGTELIALDEKDGSVLWATPVGSGSPNCTPTVDGELVFALGRNGDLLCANAQTGEPVWTKNFAQDFGGKMMSGWGYSESPLVDGDRLICTPGGNDAVVVALDKKTGELIWQAALPADVGNHGRDGAGYSSVVISNAAGIKQYVQLVGRGVIGIRAEDGKVLWTYNKIANGTANIPTPIVTGDFVFCSTGYGAGAALLKIAADGETVTAEEQYFLPGSEVQNHHGGMILQGDYVYCGNKHNNGFPICVKLSTGEIVWDGGRGPGSGSAAIVLADGHLYFRYQDGTMALIQATPEEYVLKGSFKLASVRGRSWPHPVINDGKLYLRDQDVLMVYDIKR